MILMFIMFFLSINSCDRFLLKNNPNPENNSIVHSVKNISISEKKYLTISGAIHRNDIAKMAFQYNMLLNFLKQESRTIINFWLLCRNP